MLHQVPAAIRLDVAEAVPSPRARKETKRAISFLESGSLAEARKQVDQAYKLAPASSGLNFLLGYLYFQERRRFTHPELSQHGRQSQSP